MSIVETLEIRDIGAVSTLERVRSASAAAAVSTAGLHSGMEDLGKGSQKLAGNMDKLAGAIGLVSPQAAGYVRDIAGMAKVTEVSVVGLGSFAGALGVAALAAIPVAVGIAAITANQRELNAMNDASASMLTLSLDLSKQLETERHKLALATGMQSKEIDAQNTLMAQQDEALARVEAAFAKAAAARRAAGGDVKALSRERELEIQQVNDLFALKRQGLEYTQSEAASTAELTVRTKAQAAAVAAQSEAERRRHVIELAAAKDYAELERFREETSDAMFGAAPVDKAAAALTKFDGVLEGLGLTEPRDKMVDLQMAAAEITSQFSRGAITAEQFGAAMDQVRDAKGQLLQADADEMVATVTAELDQIVADAEARAADISRRMSTVTSSVTGGPQAGMNAIANAGPFGAMVAGFAEMVVNLEDTGNSFEAYHEELLSSISELPSVIMDNIADWVVEGTTAVLEMVPNLIGNLIEELTDPATWEHLGKVFFDGFIKGQTIRQFQDKNGNVTEQSFWKGVTHFLTGSLTDSIKRGKGQGKGVDWSQSEVSTGGGYTGTYDLGGYVSQPGLAMVHKGEWIRSAAGVNSGGGAGQPSSMGGTQIQLVVNGSLMTTVPDLVRVLNREMKQAGLSWDR